MTKSERYSIYAHCLTPETPMCVNCAHYYPHFRQDGYSFECGHCGYPRIKLRYAYDACGNFIIKEDNK